MAPKPKRALNALQGLPAKKLATTTAKAKANATAKVSDAAKRTATVEVHTATSATDKGKAAVESTQVPHMGEVGRKVLWQKACVLKPDLELLTASALSVDDEAFCDMVKLAGVTEEQIDSIVNPQLPEEDSFNTFEDCLNSSPKYAVVKTLLAGENMTAEVAAATLVSLLQPDDVLSATGFAHDDPKAKEVLQKHAQRYLDGLMAPDQAAEEAPNAIAEPEYDMQTLLGKEKAWIEGFQAGEYNALVAAHKKNKLMGTPQAPTYSTEDIEALKKRFVLCCKEVPSVVNKKLQASGKYNVMKVAAEGEKALVEYCEKHYPKSEAQAQQQEGTDVFAEGEGVGDNVGEDTITVKEDGDEVKITKEETCDSLEPLLIDLIKDLTALPAEDIEARKALFLTRKTRALLQKLSLAFAGMGNGDWSPEQVRFIGVLIVAFNTIPQEQMQLVDLKLSEQVHTAVTDLQKMQNAAAAAAEK